MLEVYIKVSTTQVHADYCTCNVQRNAVYCSAAGLHLLNILSGPLRMTSSSSRLIPSAQSDADVEGVCGSGRFNPLCLLHFIDRHLIFVAAMLILPITSNFVDCGGG